MAYEDAIDALVSAWCGMCYLQGQAKAFGDERATIWVPVESTARRLDSHPPLVWCASMRQRAGQATKTGSR